MKIGFGLALLACTGFAMPTTTAAQTYPVKPVRGVIGFGAGGQIDVIARAIGPSVSELWNQPLILENRPGAGSNIAAEVVAKSAPDGYTLYFATQAVATNPVLMKSGAVDPTRQLDPVSMLGTAEAVLLVHPSVPVKTVKELVEHAKSRPGELNFATTSIGSPAHVGMELLNKIGGVRMESILYKEVGPAVSDVSAGRVKVWMTLLTAALPLVKSGTLVPIAVTGNKQLKALPDVPTIKSAYPEFESSSWYGLFAPAGTPKPILSRIASDMARALQDPKVHARLAALSIEPIGSPPERLGQYVKAELERISMLVKSGALTPN